jgi:hypothetical protein
MRRVIGIITIIGTAAIAAERLTKLIWVGKPRQPGSRHKNLVLGFLLSQAKRMNQRVRPDNGQ